METQSSATISSTPTMNKDSYDNPYYLSEDDHPGVILVSDLLNGAVDFDSWHQSMVTALKGRNKLGFVDGTLLKPLNDSCDIATWSRCNDVVRSWLMNSVSKHIAQSILNVKTARKMWNKLLKRFKQNSVLGLYEIEHQLHGLRQGSLDVSTFYKKVVSVWENLKYAQDYPACECANCECELDQKWMDLFERSFVIKFLFGLNKSYEDIRQKIIMINPLPDLEKTLSLVIQHERKKRSKQPVKSEAVDFQASLTPVMVNADLSHNKKWMVPATSSGFEHCSRVVCTHCGLQGHTINECYKLHGYPPRHKVPYSAHNGFSTSKQPQNTVPYRPQTPHFQGHQNQQFPRPKGPYQQGNMVARVNTESPAVQEHFHHVSNAFTQLHLNQVKQLDMQLGTQAQNSKPVITESIGTQNISTSAAKSKNFPAMRFGGKIVYSKTASEVDKRASQLLKILETKRDEAGRAIVGFDIEWRPSFRKGVLPGKAAVVQICVDNDYCDVMHIIHSGVPQSLKHLIQDSTIVKVGVGIDGDSVKLFHDHGVSIKDVEDLSDLANKKLSGDSKRWGLASLTETLVCKVLLKPNNIRLGNWESYTLSTEQLQYAATDAYASWHLYQVLNELPDAVDSSSHEEEAQNSKAKSKNFPAMRFGGKILYSKTTSEVDKRAAQLLEVLETKRDEAGKAIVGFDIEWRPSLRKGVLRGKVAVVQICVDNDYCDVMHILHSGIPQSLKHLIEDSTIVKVGVGIDRDSVKLFHDHGVSIKDVEDLSDLANKKLSGDSKRWGLASLTKTFVCKVLLKPNNIRLGNWEAYPLSTKQLQYAATAAYASWHLYQVLNELPDAVDSSSHEEKAQNPIEEVYVYY